MPGGLIKKQPVESEAEMAWKCLFKPTFSAGYFDQTDLVLMYDQGSSVGLLLCWLF